MTAMDAGDGVVRRFTKFELTFLITPITPALVTLADVQATSFSADALPSALDVDTVLTH